MTEWFKVVRPDMSSFADPTFVYEVGKRMRPNGVRVDGVLCRPGYLHASPTPPEAALLNARWPYRLLRVEGTPAVKEGPKAGFKQLTVVEERPVSECFGPNGVEVLRVIRRAEQLTAAETRVGDAAWDAAWDAARDAAWDAAWCAAWCAARCAAWNAAWCAAWNAARDGAWDAATAVAVRPLIGQHGFTQQHFDTLVDPWLKVLGPTWEADDDR